MEVVSRQVKKCNRAPRAALSSTATVGNGWRMDHSRQHCIPANMSFNVCVVLLSTGRQVWDM